MYQIEAIQQEGMVPVNKAEIKDVNFQMNKHLSFIAEFEIEPEVSLPRMKKNHDHHITIATPRT